MPLKIKFLHPRANYDHVGIIPDMLSESNPEKASVQLDRGYAHGGGWNLFHGFVLQPDNSLKYPGDPPTRPLAEMRLREELVVVYEHAWVAIIQPDRSFEVCRMD